MTPFSAPGEWASGQMAYHVTAEVCVASDHLDIHIMAIVMMGVVAFSSHAKIWGDGSTNLSSLALFFFFFLNWRSACAHQLPSLDKDQSTVVQ